MGNQTTSTYGADKLPRFQQKVLFDLVECTKTSGEWENWKFYYSPVLEQIEAIHPSRRKTFVGRIPSDALRYWSDTELIEMIGSRRNPGPSNPGSATVEFILRERALLYYADHHLPGIFRPFMGLKRKLLPDER